MSISHPNDFLSNCPHLNSTRKHTNVAGYQRSPSEVKSIDQEAVLFTHNAPQLLDQPTDYLLNKRTQMGIESLIVPLLLIGEVGHLLFVAASTFCWGL